MNIIEFLCAPWAIRPENLNEIQSIYATHLKGEKIDIAGIEARLGQTLSSEQKDYEIRQGGIAVLDISGVISPKANMMTKFCGGASAQVLQKQVESMASDPAVRGVVLDMDTPGGSVLGIPALATAVRALASQKPVVAVSSGMMCSAGYWVGSAANAIYISGETDYVGSIGVVATHNYNPKANGSQTTEITAGKYKRMGTESAPLTAEGQAYIQNQVDEIYRVFVETVAKNRKVSAEDVVSKMADGRTFIGQQAIDAGLVDGVSTVDAMVAKMADNPNQYASRKKAVFAVGSQTSANASGVDVEVSDLPQTHKGNSMTPNEIAEKFASENVEAAAFLKAAGAASERDRIKAVREQSMAGHEELIEALAFDGKTTGPEAAVKVLAAEKARVNTVAANRMNDSIAPVQVIAEPETKKQVEAQTSYYGMNVDQDSAMVDAKAKAYQKEHPNVDYISAVKAVTNK